MKPIYLLSGASVVFGIGLIFPLFSRGWFGCVLIWIGLWSFIMAVEEGK
jgi:hypothetical protein